MANTTYGSIKLATANDVGTVLKKKMGTQTGYKPKEWADTINLLGKLPTRTATGSIAHFTDGADDVPLKSCLLTLNPLQTGTGDPSPTNIRPITGFTGVNVTQTGANVWDEEIELGSINSHGELVPSTTTVRCKNPIPVKPNANYYFLSVSGTSETKFGFIYFYDQNLNFISSWSSEARVYNTQITTPNNCYFMRFRMASSYGTTYNNDIYINYPSTTYPIALGRTVYGGQVNLTTGEMKPFKEYDSYNGETLTGPWMCSQAPYIAGTTPPTGSQVVDLGAYDTTVQLTPTEIATLLGENNIYHDCNGDSTVEYRADIDLLINELGG